MRDNFDLFDVTLSTIIILYVPYLIKLIIQAIDAGTEWYAFLLNDGDSFPLIPLCVMLGLLFIWRATESEDSNDKRNE